MNEDQKELMQGILGRLRSCGGVNTEAFFTLLQEDPYLLKDVLNTFSDEGVRKADILTADAADHLMQVMIYKDQEEFPYLAAIHIGIQS